MKPTMEPKKEVIEAMLSLEGANIHEEMTAPTPEDAADTALGQEVNTFLVLLRESSRFRAAINVFFFKFFPKEQAENLAREHEKFHLEAAALPPEKVMEMVNLCRLMFYLGWNTRGTQNDEPEMDRIVRRIERRRS